LQASLYGSKLSVAVTGLCKAQEYSQVKAAPLASQTKFSAQAYLKKAGG